jgi:hypothetical protein
LVEAIEDLDAEGGVRKAVFHELGDDTGAGEKDSSG